MINFKKNIYRTSQEDLINYCITYSVLPPSGESYSIVYTDCSGEEQTVFIIGDEITYFCGKQFPEPDTAYPEDLSIFNDMECISPIVVPCSGIIAAGNEDGIGVYKATMTLGTGLGTAGIQYHSLNVPDRFTITYDGVEILDSKFVGNNVIDGTASGFPSFVNNVPGFTYNTSTLVFESNGEITPEVSTVYPDKLTEPTVGLGYLLFDKTTSYPTNIEITIYGLTTGTDWNLKGICPRSPLGLNSVIMFGFFNDADKHTGYRKQTLQVYYEGEDVEISVGGRFYLSPFGAGNSLDEDHFLNDFEKCGWMHIDPFGVLVEREWMNLSTGGAVKIDQYGVIVDTDW